jgi:serine/threonine-protein kinase
MQAAAVSFGKYRTLVELGRGGMAVVYLAAAEGPGGFAKLVVVKELRGELAAELEFRDMFLDEARLAARISHPNVVQTYEVTDEGGRNLIVMEYLEGQPFSNVRARLGKLGRLELGDHVRVIADMLDGLHAAHEARDWDGRPLNVVHRDVSPHNVFVTYAGEVKVVDFGIAKAATSSQQTRTGIIKGKVSYMAPEQAFGRAVDRRADVFAAGIILWEAVAMRRMWKDMPDPGIIHHLGTGDIPRVETFAPNAHPMLVRACARALAPSPADRYPTAAAMREDLEAYLAECHPRPTPRAFGALLDEVFHEERSRIRALVETEMSRRRHASTAELAAMPIPAMSIPMDPRSDAATSASSPGALASSQISRVSAVAPVQSGVTSVTMSGSLAVETGPRMATSPPAAERSRTPLFVALAALVVAVVGGSAAIAVALRSPSPPAPAAPPPPVVETTPTASAAAPGSTQAATPTPTVETQPPATGTATAHVKPTGKPTPHPPPTAKPTATTAATKPPSDILPSR